MFKKIFFSLLIISYFISNTTIGSDFKEEVYQKVQETSITKDFSNYYEEIKEYINNQTGDTLKYFNKGLEELFGTSDITKIATMSDEEIKEHQMKNSNYAKKVNYANEMILKYRTAWKH